MFIPRFVERWFTDERSVWWKIAGGALVGGLCGYRGMRWFGHWNPDIELSGQALWIATIVVAAAGGLLGLAMSMKDSVENVGSSGKPVPFLLRFFFGYGIWSLLMWFPLVAFMVFFITSFTAPDR